EFMQKVVFITGASRGIGKATAERFTKEGWKVAGVSNKTEGDYQMAMNDYDSIQKAMKKATEEMGRVDCLVNCAGIFGYKDLKQYDLETMTKVMGVNEMGMYLVTKEVLNYMTEGSMVFVSSTAAQVGSSDPVYAGTKSAVLGFVKSIAKALGPKIRVNCVAPGVTESDMTKNMNPERLKQLIELTQLKKAAVPEEIADGIYFLANATHITGACLDINGGYVLR
ncbi:MAG: Bile acid 7-dehydroxylase 1/3, partial [Candidatus Amesbacteria bacterium GW2011_GWC2_47_8]